MFNVLDAVKYTGDGQSDRLKPALGPLKIWQVGLGSILVLCGTRLF